MGSRTAMATRLVLGALFVGACGCATHTVYDEFAGAAVKSDDWAALHDSVTTRAEAIRRLGPPSDSSPDGRTIRYVWEQHVQVSEGITNSSPVAGRWWHSYRGPTSLQIAELRFDESDVLQQHFIETKRPGGP